MILFVTTAPNDSDLARVLGNCVIRCPIVTDIAFWGKGDNGVVVRVGVERKKPGDLSACITDGRYLQQVQTAKDDGIDILVLILEGRIHCNPDDGLLEVPVWGINPRTLKRAEIYRPVQPSITYSRFIQFLYEVEYLLSIQVMRTENVRETADVIRALYAFHQKPPDAHQSLHSIYRKPIPTIQLTRPSLMRRISSELEGIGWKKSRDVAEHFGSVLEMMLAGEDEWQKISGIGKTIAKRVVADVRKSWK